MIKYILYILRNKIVVYVLTRYLVLFIGFISSIFLAARLGPYYLGIWGFILLLLNYFQYFDFGISDSTTVLLVQFKDDSTKTKNLETNSIILTSFLNSSIVLLSILYYLYPFSLFDKYNIDHLFYFICLIAILVNYNKLFFKVSRVKGKIFEIGFYQSIIVLLVFIVLFFARERKLLLYLVGAYIIGHVFSMFFFFKSGNIVISGKPNLKDSFTIISKGFLLFIYNLFFYLILLSTRTIISTYYSVEEFGYFTLSFTLANAILLILDAFTILIIPKALDKFYSEDVNVIENTLRLIKLNYVYVSYGLMFLTVIFFAILLVFLPKFYIAFKVINILSLSIVFSTNSFAYSMYLRAINKENILAMISFFSFIINIVVAIILAKFFKVNFSFISLSILLSYLFFASMCVYFGKRSIYNEVTFKSILSETLSINLLVPIVLLIIITIFDLRIIIFVPFLSFVFLNFKFLKQIFVSSKQVLFNSKIFDIN
ncbi:MAG: hypothetical protein AB7S48_10190 [Bacteroidales bacterium]